MSSNEHAIEEPETPVLRVSPDLRVNEANGPAHALLGYPDGYLVGTNMTALFQPRRQAELRNFDQLLAGGGARRWRTALLSYDGKQREVAISLSGTLDDGGQVESVHVRLEEAAPRSERSRQSSSGVHSSVSSPFREERLGPRPATAPPVERRDARLLHASSAALEEARTRLAEIEALALPATGPMGAERRSEVARLSRQAMALIDEAASLLSRQR